MKGAIISLASLLAATAKAQSAPEFDIVVSQNLPVTYEGTNTEVAPGVLLDGEVVQDQPAVSLPRPATNLTNASGNKTYVMFMIDQDVPQNGTRTTILHWFGPDMTRSAENSSLVVDEETSTIQGAIYFPPSPPEGDGPHRYTFLLYEQPDDFAIPEAYDFLESPDINTREGFMPRFGFNLSDFAQAATLGEPIAANYIRVMNGTEAETSSAATITGTVGVAPTEQPTTVATTDSEAAASASASASASAAEGESGTADASSPVETGDGSSGAGPVFEGVRGLAVAAIGAAVFL